MLRVIHKLATISLNTAKEKKSLTENDCVLSDTQVYSRGNNHPLHIRDGEPFRMSLFSLNEGLIFDLHK